MLQEGKQHGETEGHRSSAGKGESEQDGSGLRMGGGKKQFSGRRKK